MTVIDRSPLYSPTGMLDLKGNLESLFESYTDFCGSSPSLDNHFHLHLSKSFPIPTVHQSYVHFDDVTMNISYRYDEYGRS